MKLLALVTPCAALAVLWAWQRLEVWMDEPQARAGAHARPPWHASGRSHPGAERG